MFGGFPSGRDNKLSAMIEPEGVPKSRSRDSNVTGFDPEGLERAAKAARDLDKSRNARAAIDLIKAQELTKQHQAAAARAEQAAYAEQLRGQNIEREEIERRKTLDQQTEHHRRQAQYGDELERKRQVDMLNAQKYMQDEQLRKQEEMVARQEAARRRTAEIEAELRTKTAVAQAHAESEGRIRQERENHDLMMEKVRLQASEHRDTMLKAVADGVNMVGKGLSGYLTDGEKLRNTAFVLTATAVGIYSARTSVGIFGRYVEARLGRPSLVRETSRERLGGTAMVWTALKRARNFIAGKKSPSEDALEGIVLESELDAQLRRISVATANTKRNGAPFRHLLLHGPPGTGKTMFAKGLAAHSGLEYAILTGGDIAPLGREAVTELHKLFDWARTSRKGLLLFVDEADAFLQSRGSASTGGDAGSQPQQQSMMMSEDQRNALNAFLYRTGTETNEFMMVYASNRPDQFDRAVLDRVDEMVEFDLPGPDERRRMLGTYIDKYLLQKSSSTNFNPFSRGAVAVKTEGIGEEEIEEAVRLTEGFSGRSIAKLAIAWQAAAYGTEGAVLDRDTFFRTLELHREGMNTKERWTSGQDYYTTRRSEAQELVADS